MRHQAVERRAGIGHSVVMARRFRSIITVGSLLLLAGCGGAGAPRRPIPVLGPPAAAPTLAPSPTAPPVVASPPGDWRDWPLTPGDWVYRQDARGSIALFGVPGRDALVTLRCDKGLGAVYLSRASNATTPAPVTIRTSSQLRTLTAQPTGGTPPYVAMAFTPRDAMLDAMGFSRGRFIVQQAGHPVLVIPAWAEILRVVEDCRG